MTTTAEQIGLAEKMLETLRARREQGPTAYPLTLRRLGQLASPEADDKAVLHTAGEEAFIAAALVSQNQSLDAFVALREDKAELASTSGLLQNVLDQLCTEDRRLCPVDKVAAKLNPDLQDMFVETVQRLVQENRLPDGIGVRTDNKGPHLFLKRLPPAPPPRRVEDTVAEQLLDKLKSQGRPGSPEFPLSLKRLIELSGTGDEKVIKKALAVPAFSEQIVMAARKNPESPLALREDVAALAASPKLLDFALHLVCSEAKPTCPPDKVAAKLDSAVQPAVAEAVQRRLESREMPEAVGVFQQKAGPVLFLKKWPPKVAPEVMLAQKMVETLEQLRTQGPEAYPLTLSQLVRRVESDPVNDVAVIKAAMAKAPFNGRVLMALKNDADSPLALSEDAERLASSPVLLEKLLTATRGDDNHAQPMADLMRPLNPALKEAFEKAKLPDTVGSVIHKGKRLVFLKADMNRQLPPRPTPAPEPVETSAVVGE